MVAGMNMFRQRSLRRPCPYRNERFFLDPQFTSLWCIQYKNDYLGHEKTFEFSIGFENHYNGIAPDCAVTNKKWVQDVDTLYITHNICNSHWVAVENDKPGTAVYTPEVHRVFSSWTLFTGIDDTNVGDIRLKYAAEMMDEVDLSDFLQPTIPKTSPYPRGTSDDARRGWRRIRWIRCSETIV
ncbi:unnamed protein product [Microthlaspi erraticum]|uniref:Ubiquitin-like protease family profile domain-containing protein n=1 Tax=Microthlaspi erraticum TaxID=1685480 RepID=A0A6D2I5N9_9BRAS|nr:unnamed protein product [Microthlaspi erraticum]